MNDGTIVGTLDAAMNRTVASRTSGSGVDSLPGLQGKLKFLADNNITNVVTNYQGTTGAGGALPALRPRSYRHRQQPGAVSSPPHSSKAKSRPVRCGTRLHRRGRYFVAGAGSVGGIPGSRMYPTYCTLDPTDTMGTDTINFSFLADTNANGTLNLVNEAGMPEASSQELNRSSRTDLRECNRAGLWSSGPERQPPPAGLIIPPVRSLR